MLTLHLQSIDEPTQCITISAQSKWSSIKREVSSVFGCNTDEIRLIWLGKQFDDDDTVVESGVFNNSTICLAARVKGGSEKSKKNWKPDESASACIQCKTAFTFFTRRHHCRICGDIFCDPCTSLKIVIPKDLLVSEKDDPALPQRACRKCYISLPALLKIQRMARNFLSRKQHEAEQNWKIFSDLESIEEKEKLMVSQFLNILLTKIPTAVEARRREEMEEQNAEMIEMGDVEVEAFTEKARRKKLQSRKSYHNLTFLSSPQANDEVAKDIIDVIRLGRRVGRDLIVSILLGAKGVLEEMPNITEVTVPESGKVVVVGDIHGQASDLLHILDEAGPPSGNNKYVFNGDFVDRGDHGVEVMCILLALLVSSPGNVYLNRGNHEDGLMNRMYGFEEECIRKYDETLFEMFADLFNDLPIFCLVDKAVLVVHGGLFPDPYVRLADLDAINRTNLRACDISMPDEEEEEEEEEEEVQGGNAHVKQPGRDEEEDKNYESDAGGCFIDAEPDQGMGEGVGGEKGGGPGLDVGVKGGAHAADEQATTSAPQAEPQTQTQLQGQALTGQQLLRCALWSDPQEENGVAESQRGTGIMFGPDIAKAFMDTNNLSMVIRSHQCVRRGIDFPYAMTDDPATAMECCSSPSSLVPLLCTLFSVSNYCEADNEAAYLILMNHKHSKSFPVGASGLFFSVHRFTTSTASTEAKNNQNSSLRDLIARKRNALLVSFEAIDVDGTGSVTRSQWSQTMQSVTGIKMRWLALLHRIAPPGSISPAAVDYNSFLASFATSRSPRDGSPLSPLSLQSAEGNDPPPSASGGTAAGGGGGGTEGATSAGGERSSRKDSSSQAEGVVVGSGTGTGSEAGGAVGADPSAGAGVGAGTGTSGRHQQIMNTMYAHRGALEAAFRFLDKDGDGLLSREDLAEGWKSLRALHPSTPGGAMLDLDMNKMMDLIDLDASGFVSMNEFFEVHRLVEDHHDNQYASSPPSPPPPLLMLPHF